MIGIFNAILQFIYIQESTADFDSTPPTPCNQYLDTFDQCVKVADHTEAILAYYYKDEHGKLKTTEIFKLEEPAAVQPPSAAELVSALAAKKLKTYGSTRSVVSAVNMEDAMDDDSSSISGQTA